MPYPMKKIVLFFLAILSTHLLLAQDIEILNKERGFEKLKIGIHLDDVKSILSTKSTIVISNNDPAQDPDTTICYEVNPTSENYYHFMGFPVSSAKVFFNISTKTLSKIEFSFSENEDPDMIHEALAKKYGEGECYRNNMDNRPDLFICAWAGKELTLYLDTWHSELSAKDEIKPTTVSFVLGF